MKRIDPRKNYEESCKTIGYVNRKEATQADYDRIGFMSGLEVHQQLLTKNKLFCRCPAGFFQKPDEYDAQLIRHMRPTLSELGEYDGTALMEFKTKKEIIYRIANKTACTYDVDDTPPFPINREALEIALEISLLSKLNIVGEVHITRKQYLDGSIPTGFQRTAILGVEGEIPLRHKKVRLIQLSIEEDSCREVSDIGHTRVYRTDRLGMPLIETVTYPDMVNPDEVKEACDYIRFLNRSTGKVRTGIGAGREDVNVSCRGGHRVEIKGVSRTKWIPELTHVEAFRQWALLHIREELRNRIQKEDWKMDVLELKPKQFQFDYQSIRDAIARNEKLYAVNLPCFGGLLSHFSQPGKPFYDEFTNRLKVIACIEKPNMATSEDIEEIVGEEIFNELQKLFNAKDNDAQIIFWSPEADVKTALETIEERCLWTFDGIPNETRKSFEDGTTIFERVLPGADRMYPDTDSAPIPLKNEYIDSLRDRVPDDVFDRYNQLIEWGVPTSVFYFLFTHNYYPTIKKIADELGYNPKHIALFFGQTLKKMQGKYQQRHFDPQNVYQLFAFLKQENMDTDIAPKMLEEMFKHPQKDFREILKTLNYKKVDKEEILQQRKRISESFVPKRKKTSEQDRVNYVMGALRPMSEGNISLTELSKELPLQKK